MATDPLNPTPLFGHDAWKGDQDDAKVVIFGRWTLFCIKF
jgi:hypothetical protein